MWQEGSIEDESGAKVFREEIEKERQRAAVLVAALNSAKRERDVAMQKLRDLSNLESKGIMNLI